MILRPISSQKCVVRCALNPIYSQLRQTNWLEPLLFHRTGRGLISQQMESGVGDLKRHFLMCESSTPMPPLTRTRRLPPVTENMRRRKNEPMNRGYARWSTRLLLHLFSRPQEEWPGERGNLFLQTPGLHACSEVGSSIYCTTLWWLRCCLTFSFIRSAIQALRGARPSRGQAAHPPAAIDLAITETHITPDF